MARSVKKGPYIQQALMTKVETMNSNNAKKVIKTWARSSTIIPDFVGHTFAVHNGNKFIPVYVTENMVGHKLGEFSPTRLFRGHTGAKAVDKKATGVPTAARSRQKEPSNGIRQREDREACEEREENFDRRGCRDESSSSGRSTQNAG